MNPDEYKDVVETLKRLADEMRELGARQADWTEEDTARWEIVEKQHEELVASKQLEDNERTARAVEDRLAVLDSPAATRTTVAPRSMVRRMFATPEYHGRLSCFRSETAKDDAYDVGLWIKATILQDKASRDLLKQRQPEWRVQTEGVGTAGGYTVPAPLASAIIEVLNEVSVAMRVSDGVPMTSDTLDMPKVTSGQTVYYPGEKGATTLSDMAFGQVALRAVKRATLTKVSNELIADSVISMADRVAKRAAYELAYQMDNEFINGDGTSTYGGETGLISSIGSAGVAAADGNAWSEVTLANLISCFGTLPDRFRQDGQLSWIMRRDFHAQTVLRLLYAAGGNAATDIAAGVPPSLFGYPINFTARMPAAGNSLYAAFFGNFTEAVMLGQRDTVSIAQSQDYAFDEDVTTIRVTHRYDINVHEPGTSAAAGAYVGLQLAGS